MDSQSYNTADDEIAGPSVVYHEEGVNSRLHNEFILIYIRQVSFTGHWSQLQSLW